MRGAQLTVPVIHIRAVEGVSSPLLLWTRLRETWDYRELLVFLTWRDLRIRYKQTVLGAVWAVLQPVLTMTLFSIFFGVLLRAPSDGIPYPIFAYCGLLPWQLFAFALSSASNSLIVNDRLVTKVYFPRIILPISAILSGLVDFFLAFLVLLLLMWYYGFWPSVAILTLPAFVVLAIVAAGAVGVGLSALNVRFRDVRYTLPFLTQCWFLATPIGYPSSLVPKPWRMVYGLNPMAGVVEGFRWALVGQAEPFWPMLLVSIGMVALVMTVSFVYFMRVELTFADEI